MTLFLCIVTLIVSSYPPHVFRAEDGHPALMGYFVWCILCLGMASLALWSYLS